MDLADLNSISPIRNPHLKCRGTDRHLIFMAGFEGLLSKCVALVVIDELPVLAINMIGN